MNKPKFEKINIKDLILESINLYKPNYKYINFIFEDLSDSKNIVCDYSQINRVLINIIKNSIESIEEKNLQSSKKQGEIIIKLNDTGENFQIFVIDNGVGFKDNKLSNETNTYYTTKKNGSGLGLSIVSKILHEHNGYISINNAFNDSGANISIVLPKKQ